MTSTALSPSWRSAWRRLFGPLASTALVLAAAFAKEGFRRPSLFAAAFASIAAAITSGRAESRRTRALFWALSFAILAAEAEASSPWFGLLSAAAGFTIASIARSTIHHTGGVGLARGDAVRKSPARLAMATVWGASAAAWAMRIWRPMLHGAAFASDVAIVAVYASSALLVLESVREWRAARLSLDTPARALLSITASTLAIAPTTFFLLERSPFAPAVGPFGLLLTAWLASWAWETADGAKVARRGRHALSLSIVGGAVLLLGAVVATGRPQDAGLVVMITGAAAIVIGTVTTWIEEPFLPEHGLWLHALDKACAAVHEHPPEEASRSVLEVLRGALGPEAPSPKIWTLEPCKVTSVDTAGYVRDQEAEPPPVIAIASSEVAATLRRDVLEALQVKRGELRPLLAWMDRERALLATVVTHNGEACGLFVLPATLRADRITLEEVLAAKRLADALGASCHAETEASRAARHAMELEARAELAEGAVQALDQRRRATAAIHEHAASNIAERVQTVTYSTAARFAMDALADRAASAGHAFVVAPVGTLASAWVARAHVESPRREAPFVLVDAALTRWHTLAPWTHRESSPLLLAEHGTLCVENIGALPAPLQEWLAGELTAKEESTHGIAKGALQVVVTSVETEEALSARGHLHKALRGALLGPEGAPIVLPRLEERPEDLRALVTEGLARAGMRLHGAPSGIEPAAYARLVEHPFAGGEQELSLVLELAVQRSTGEVVLQADLEKVLGGGRAARGWKDPAK